eukprot:CAMPEP_0184468084 /NCGR_PEP_ID=MMETSP0740-20130409/76649_1 /TAXON_ID=385413 /ORGANISM="Thalassiosira miniscula, Strain CCMP1093" /LENGTH=50 /DNA_ID=CAMNT_0026843597 /DNA_START=227 /DNA_END=379 /DNA_ORIENTATION=-
MVSYPCDPLGFLHCEHACRSGKAALDLRKRGVSEQDDGAGCEPLTFAAEL